MGNLLRNEEKQRKEIMQHIRNTIHEKNVKSVQQVREKKGLRVASLGQNKSPSQERVQSTEGLQIN